MRRTITFISVFALVLTMLALPAAAAAEPCQLADGYTDKYDVPDSNVPGSVPIMYEGEQIGTIYYNTPGTGQLTIELDAGAEIDLCVFGGNDRQEYTDVGDGFVTEPLLNAPGNFAGVSNFAWKVTQPPLVLEGLINVDKTAVGTYDRTVNWRLVKRVREAGLDPEGTYGNSVSFSGNPGDEFDVDWRVGAVKQESSGNFKVAGDIDITYANVTVPVPFTVADTLSDGTVAAVTCPVNTIPVGADTITCTYEAFPTNANATSNGVVVTLYPPAGFELLAGSNLTDTEPIVWNETVIGDDEVTLADARFDYSELISASSRVDFEETFECPTDRSKYNADRLYSETFTNTATLKGDNTDLSASATVTINCEWELVFKDETAWAANGDVAGQLRYTPRGNWATYVAYAPKTTTLFAGQTIPVGTVTFSAVTDDEITITVNLSGGWEFEDVLENLKVQNYSSAPSGNPEPGLFDHKEDCDAESNTCSIEVPADNYYGVHVNVGKWVEATY
jgi:hypothetical protein